MSYISIFLKKFMAAMPAVVLCALVAGCMPATKPYDYTAFKRSNPKSILVLPPLNNSPEIAASYSMLSVATLPLAESGYYVFPVAVVDETFKQNGLANAADIHAVSLTKLHEIFGADTALYMDIRKYGSSYTIIQSEVLVVAEAKLVDLRTGDLLWKGSASASSAENQNNSNGGLAGLLIQAIVQQIANSLSDQSHVVAGVASQRLLRSRVNGMLYGPRSPLYGKDALPQ